MSRIEQIVFDLDDTLLDTTRLLLPQATSEAIGAMVRAGLKTDLDHGLRFWHDWSLRQDASTSRLDIFQIMIEHFGVQPGTDAGAVIAGAKAAFYHRKVETNIDLFSGAREMLVDLKSRYTLHLVTSGNRETQEEKILILRIAPLFTSILHVDPSKGQRKREAFLELMNRSRQAAHLHLSVGNRVDSDIGDAKEVGWTTCWVRYGEHAAMTPIRKYEIPDFTISSVSELVSTCQL